MADVSVIVPVLNGEEYLGETLESVIAQRGVSLEINVVDDGSIDRTAAVLADFYPHIRVAKTRNRGVSAALNTAILMSTAPLIAWISADDRWLPEKCALQKRVMDENKNVVFSHTAYEIIGPDGKPTGQPAEGPHTEKWKEEMMQGTRINGMTVMMRREALYESGLFDRALGGKSGYCADGKMWFCLAHRGMAYIPKVLAQYRVHPQMGQITRVSQELRQNTWAEFRAFMGAAKG